MFSDLLRFHKFLTKQVWHLVTCPLWQQVHICWWQHLSVESCLYDCRFSKYWHAHRLNSLDFKVLFLDTDVVLLQDPFQFHDRQFDIEGWVPDLQAFPQSGNPCIVGQSSILPQAAACQIAAQQFPVTVRTMLK